MSAPQIPCLAEEKLEEIPANVSADDGESDHANGQELQAQVPMPAQNLPDLVLDAICRHLSFKEVLTCAHVCRRWRDYVRKCPRWCMVALGQEVHCHGPLSDQFVDTHIADITDVKFTTALPSFISTEGEETENVILDVPIGFLKILLRDATRLVSLDLSSLMTRDLRSTEVLSLWSDEAAFGAKQLKKL